MKDSPTPPPAPDPQATASAQSSSNIDTAIANARLNRVNQQTPFGNITYTQGPADASGVPSYSSQIQLSPQQQVLLNQQQQRQQQSGALAQQYLGQVSGQPLNLSGLAPINNRGQMYGGAVNAPQGQPTMPPQPQGAPQNSNPFAGLAGGGQLDPQVMQQIMALLGQHGISPPSQGAQPPGTNPLMRSALPQILRSSQ